MVSIAAEFIPNPTTGYYKLHRDLMHATDLDPAARLVLMDMLDRAGRGRPIPSINQRAVELGICRTAIIRAETVLAAKGYLLAGESFGRRNVYVPAFPAVPETDPKRPRFLAALAEALEHKTSRESIPVVNRDRSAIDTTSSLQSRLLSDRDSLLGDLRDLETGIPPTPQTHTEPALTERQAAGPDGPTTRTEREDNTPLPEPPPARESYGGPRPTVLRGAKALGSAARLAELQRYFGANAARLDCFAAARLLAEFPNLTDTDLAACVTDARLFLEEKDGGDPFNLGLLTRALEKWASGGVAALRAPERAMVIPSLMRYDASAEAAARDRAICIARYGAPQ